MRLVAGVPENYQMRLKAGADSTAVRQAWRTQKRVEEQVNRLFYVSARFGRVGYYVGVVADGNLFAAHESTLRK